MNESLLFQLLEIIKGNQIHSKEAAAASLGVSDDRITMMIDQLLRLGYLEEIGAHTANSLCAECGIVQMNQNGCEVCAQKGRAFLLTSKAMKTFRS
jgi:hypothetical protein